MQFWIADLNGMSFIDLTHLKGQKIVELVRKKYTSIRENFKT